MTDENEQASQDNHVRMEVSIPDAMAVGPEDLEPAAVDALRAAAKEAVWTIVKYATVEAHRSGELKIALAYLATPLVTFATLNMQGHPAADEVLTFTAGACRAGGDWGFEIEFPTPEPDTGKGTDLFNEQRDPGDETSGSTSS